MKYFTLSEDLAEISSSKRKLKIRIIGVSGLVVLFFTLRTFGFLTIEFNRAFLQGKHESSKEVLESYSNGTGSSYRKNGNLKTDDNDRYGHLGFSSSFGGFLQSDKEFLEKLIKERILKDKVISRRFEFAVISVEKLNMSGVYWLPLYKNGTSSYRIIVENRYFQDTYSANFTGGAGFEIYGICSINKLDEIVADKIAKIVVDSIKEDYKK